MSILIIAVLCTLAVTKISIQTKFSKKNGDSVGDNVFFNGLSFAVSALIVAPSLIKSGAEYQTVLQGIAMGVLSFIFQFCYVIALKNGKMAPTVIINNFSMLIPIAASVFILNERLTFTKITGMIFALTSFVLTAAKNGDTTTKYDKNNSYRTWFICVSLVFLSNGLISANQKLYSAYSRKLEVFQFVAVAYITAAVISFFVLIIISLKDKRPYTVAQPNMILSACGVGIVLGIFQCLNTYAASVIDGAILYSTYNCAVSLLSAVAGRLLFKERMTPKQSCGIITGTAAIVLLCL